MSSIRYGPYQMAHWEKINSKVSLLQTTKINFRQYIMMVHFISWVDSNLKFKPKSGNLPSKRNCYRTNTILIDILLVYFQHQKTKNKLMKIFFNQKYFYVRTVNFVDAVFVILSLVTSSLISQLPTPGFFQAHLRRSVSSVDFDQMRLLFVLLSPKVILEVSFSFSSSSNFKIPILQRELLGDTIEQFWNCV